MEQKIETAEDLTKAWNDLKKSIEEKGEEATKNFGEKIAAIEKSLADLADKKAEDKTAETLAKMQEDLAITIKALDVVQVRMKGSSKPPKVESKSIQTVISEAVEANHDAVQKFMRKETKKVSFDIDMKTVGEFGTNNVTGGTVWGAVYKPGIIENPSRKTHLRSLISSMAAGPGTDYYFMRENGNGEGSIAPTAEATSANSPHSDAASGLKPQFDLDLIESSVKFETIAGFMILSNKSLNNIQGLVSFLQKRVPEKLLNVEDAQILYGNGTTPNLKGILTSGNFVASASASTKLVEKIIDDLSLLDDTYERQANGIIMRPSSYYSFFKNKATGSGEYDLPQGVTFVNGVLYILGVPVATTTALNTGDYVVGDFTNGTDLLIQESMRLEFFREDGTNVRTNQVTLRIEETIALPVYGSTYFVKGDTGEGS
jgi:HK97 family phage major capsid protein